MESKQTEIYCRFCHAKIEGNVNSAAPLYEGYCCDDCYTDIVIPMRLKYEELLAKKEQNKNCVKQVSYKKDSPKFDYFKKERILTNYKNNYMREEEPFIVKQACQMIRAFGYINSDFISTYQSYIK